MGLITVFVRERCRACDLALSILTVHMRAILAEFEGDYGLMGLTLEIVDTTHDLPRANQARALTGQPTAPQIFFNAQWAGNCSDIEALASKGELVTRLTILSRKEPVGIVDPQATVVKLTNDCAFASQLSQAQFARLKSKGVATVISLIDPRERGFRPSDEKKAEEAGLFYRSISTRRPLLIGSGMLAAKPPSAVSSAALAPIMSQRHHHEGFVLSLESLPEVAETGADVIGSQLSLSGVRTRSGTTVNGSPETPNAAVVSPSTPLGLPLAEEEEWGRDAARDLPFSSCGAAAAGAREAFKLAQKKEILAASGIILGVGDETVATAFQRAKTGHDVGVEVFDEKAQQRLPCKPFASRDGSDNLVCSKAGGCEAVSFASLSRQSSTESARGRHDDSLDDDEEGGDEDDEDVDVIRPRSTDPSRIRSPVPHSPPFGPAPSQNRSHRGTARSVSPGPLNPPGLSLQRRYSVSSTASRMSATSEVESLHPFHLHDDEAAGSSGGLMLSALDDLGGRSNSLAVVYDATWLEGVLKTIDEAPKPVILECLSGTAACGVGLTRAAIQRGEKASKVFEWARSLGHDIEAEADLSSAIQRVIAARTAAAK